MLDTFRKTFSLVGRERPGRWAVLIVGAVIVSGFEMVGAVLVYLLLALIADPGGELNVPLMGDVRGLAHGLDDQAFLLATALVLGAFFLIRLGVAVTHLYAKHRMAHNAAADLSSRLAEGYLLLPYPFHLRRNSAELVRNAHQTVEQLADQCFLAAIYVISETVVVVGLLVVMVLIAPLGTALAIVIVGGAALLLLKTVQPRLKREGDVAQEMRMQTLATLHQSLHGIRDIKVLGGESHFGRTYQRDRRRLARALYHRGLGTELPRHVIETALIGFILVFFAVSVLAGMQSEALLSTLGLFAYAGLRVMPSLQKIVRSLNNLRFAGPAVDQVSADLRLVQEIDRSEPTTEALPFEHELQLRGVSYRYEETPHPAVADANIVIRRGEFVGICGPTGGGKTTLADLVTGILPASAGEVTVDGRDIQEHLPAWYRRLGIVPQMVFLADDTVRRNIALGVPDEAIDDAAVTDALRRAQLDDVVAALPDGLDTEIGERGVRLSGGQRQRVAIARALYRKPDVLIFDEGTSSLDNATEAALVSALESLRGEHTILLIAHRLSTVRRCDRIFYLEGGRVAASGTFSQLRATSAGFRALSEGTHTDEQERGTRL